MYIEIGEKLYNLFQISIVSKDSKVVEEVTVYTLRLSVQNGTVLEKEYATEAARDAQYNAIKALTI